MAMPQCCYLAKGAKRPSHTTNTIKFDRIPFDPCNSIKRFDLSPFDQKNSTYLQPPPGFLRNRTGRCFQEPGTGTGPVPKLRTGTGTVKNRWNRPGTGQKTDYLNNLMKIKTHCVYIVHFHRHEKVIVYHNQKKVCTKRTVQFNTANSINSIRKITSKNACF